VRTLERFFGSRPARIGIIPRVAHPTLSNAFAASDRGDIDILNFALTLAYLETNFYQGKGHSFGLSGPAKALAAEVGDEQAEPVGALSKAISAAGGKPVFSKAAALKAGSPLIRK
jgi:hypothetical protein